MTRLTAFALAVLMLLVPGCRSGGGGDGGAGGEPGPGTTADLPPGLAWEWRAPQGASTGMPTADDRQVAFTYGHQYLVVLDEKGRERWQAARLGLRDVAPRLAGDLVLAATEEGVAAFRRADGSPAWDTRLPARANTPVVVAGRAVTSTWEGQLVGLDLADGRVAWRTALPGGAIAPPVADGSTVVVAWQREDQRAAGVLAVEAATARTRWTAPVEPGGVGGPTATPDGAVVL
ncbi:MAG: PQQ-binding-like beta-propeller repeat protein, partial [Actinomycetota bacterium]|nr:PQQ-binding-like beta-propeller repeat protein [Actinomycetota bacterium]